MFGIQLRERVAITVCERGEPISKREFRQVGVGACRVSSMPSQRGHSHQMPRADESLQRRIGRTRGSRGRHARRGAVVTSAEVERRLDIHRYRRARRRRAGRLDDAFLPPFAMTAPLRSHDAVPAAPTVRAPWKTPSVTELPKLTQLTLQTGAPIDGGGNPGGGSTVIP
jgi:hypothetical protein